MTKTKIKNIRKTILMLMGGVTLISTPLAITSCGNNWKWETQSFSDAETAISWLSSLITVNNETKTVHTPDEYGSFFCNDLTLGDLWFACYAQTVILLLAPLLSEGKKITISTVINEHKVGLKIIKQGTIENVTIKVDFSTKGILNIVSTSKDPSQGIDEYFKWKQAFEWIDFYALPYVFVDLPFGLCTKIGMSGDQYFYACFVLQSEFPNYTFQSNN